MCISKVASFNIYDLVAFQKSDPKANKLTAKGNIEKINAPLNTLSSSIRCAYY
jgi:hypothetical protein